MRLDRFGNPIYNSKDIFQALYKEHVDILSKVAVDTDEEIEKLSLISNTNILHPLILDDSVNIEDFDHAMQLDWFMPDIYKNLDIKSWILEKCSSETQLQRVNEELVEFEKRNMINLLRWLKYFVDTCNQENIIWGVGRGSSVASYVLYLIGVHKIDSIKYNLDWQEFLR
jgi:DNA polymerase III alpha subunit